MMTLLSRVASEYASVLAYLGRAISHQKSLISNTGVFEFAKRFFVRARGYFRFISSISSSIENVQMDSGISSPS